MAIIVEGGRFLVFSAILVLLSIQPAMSVEDNDSLNNKAIITTVATTTATTTTTTTTMSTTKMTTPKPEDTECKDLNSTRYLRTSYFNSSYPYPEFYYVNCTTITCLSPDHISWMVSFQPPLEINTTVDLPYKLQFVWTSCTSGNNADRLSCNRTGYFNSSLNFQQSIFYKRLLFNSSVEITCSSQSPNSPTSATWDVTFNGTVNLSKGHVRPDSSSSNSTDNTNALLTPTNSSLPQPTVTLEMNASHHIHNCTINDGRNDSRPVAIFECADWANCQQRAAQLSKGVHVGSLGHSHKTFAIDSNYPISISSGIIYCKIDDDWAVYWPFFKTASTFMHILTRSDDESLKIWVDLKERETTKSEMDFYKDYPVRKTCSAPKFLAVKGFEWLVTNGSHPHNNLLAEACEVKNQDTTENFVEECKCKRPSNETSVTCTVHFHSGESVNSSSIPETRQIERDTNNPSSTLSPEDNFNRKLTIGVGVGMFVCLIILLAVLICCYCKIRRQKKQIYFSAEELDEFMKGSVMLNNLASATVLPYDLSLEVSRDKIKFEATVLGQGAFGKVIKGRIGDRFVAIKTIKKNVEGQYFRALLSELKIMTYVGKHPNIVELVGANTERIQKQDVFLIFEFCENGNALTFIRGKREMFANQLSEDFQAYVIIESNVEYSNGIGNKICCEDLIRWAMEVAAGMEFIASKKVYHGDLAARNILLSHSLVAKVGDFGLAKELKDYSLYVQRMECPLPLKWMSIESLRDLEFSIQSDIWSYGVTLWEMFSLGSSPYPGVDWNFQSWKMLADGNRMDRPSHATQSIYNILLKCWQAEPQDRPSFGELKEMFRTELKKLDRREVLPQSKLQEVKVPPIREKDRRNRVMTWLR